MQLKECSCNREGAELQGGCNSITGSCTCKPGYRGLNCDECENGYFTTDDKVCQRCLCLNEGVELALNEQICNNKTGACLCKSNFIGTRCEECASGFFNFPKCQRKRLKH